MSALRVALAVAKAGRALVAHRGVVARSVGVRGVLHLPIEGPSHRSDAQERIARVPPIVVDGPTATCDGGGGATGHPIEYIQLNKRAGHVPEVCKYCGLRYVMKEHGHGKHVDTAGHSASAPHGKPGHKTH